MSAYDVIIAGAGPAGASAAYFLGEAGRRVLVIEKETLPRYKTCGGGLSVRFLEKTFPFSFEPVIERDMKAITYVFDGQTVTVPVGRRRLEMVMRDRFDAHLLAHAKAEVRQGTTVHGVNELPDRVLVQTSEGDVVEGRYLIGADSANSVVARALGLRRSKTLAAALEAEVPVTPEGMRRFAEAPVFIFGDVRFGYAWIFPKAEQLSVGVAAWHPRPGELQSVLTRVAARYDLPLQSASVRGHPIPIYIRRERIATARVLLAGDAAGLADPFSGEGIRLAITSGRLAAKAILAGHPERYERLVFWRIGLNQTFGLAVAGLFYNLPLLCLTFGAYNPFTTSALMDLLAGRATYPGVLLRAIGTLPLFVLSNGLAAVTQAFTGDKTRAASHTGA